MHHSRLCAVLIDCKSSDVDAAADFWAKALGRDVDSKHPGSRGNYRMLEAQPDESIVQIQRVEHDSRVHIDIETDDIPAEVGRLNSWAPEWAPRVLSTTRSAYRSASSKTYLRESKPAALRLAQRSIR